MSPNEILVGVTYHNGKEGPRSYSARKVLDIGTSYTVPFSGQRYHDGVTYKQVEGRFKGSDFTIPLKSFAKWAKGIKGTV